MLRSHVEVSQQVVLRCGRRAVCMHAGDGKLGLLVAQVLACSGRCGALTLIGRHAAKMALVTGGASSTAPACAEAVGGAGGALRIERVSASDEAALAALAGRFDMTVEASGGLWRAAPPWRATAARTCHRTAG